MTASRVLKVLAVGTVALFGLFGGLFVAGAAMDEPGGLTGAGMVAAFGVPLMALAVLALRWPGRAARWLPLALAAVAVLIVVDAVAIATGHFGPGASLAVFVVAVPCGLLGAHRPLEAGLLVLGGAALGVLEVLALMVRQRGGDGASFGTLLGGSDGVIVVPLLVCAVLLLLAAAAERLGRGDHSLPTAPTAAGHAS